MVAAFVWTLMVLIFSPRLISFLLYFFSGWFTGVFQTSIWPILGWMFMPFTMLWYSCVMNWYGGHWGFETNLLMVVAILVDWGVGSSIIEEKSRYGRSIKIKFR